ncbi:MAG: cation diffusion facilitator family transporter [Elusimicrobiota bacterium]|jgi:cobalt-zinc-cadmium efflux system protein|nr:cation diffusion facilitator family transporter [Elusimicrobiota bacterium]
MEADFHKHNHAQPRESEREHRRRARSHGAGAGKRALSVSFILITAFMALEVAGGLISGSLALLSDAGHMLSDAFALGLSLCAVIAGRRAATKAKTYGFKRFEVLAAFFNALTIFLIAVFILKEAIARIQNPAPVLSGPMFFIAAAGLLVNIAVLFILRGGEHKENLNVKSAMLHVLGDLLGSAGVIIAAALIYFFGWYAADPLISIIMAALIFYSAWKIFAESVNILLEGAPAHINIDGLKAKIKNTKGVKEVEDIHIWSISSSFLIFTAAVEAEQNTDRDALLCALKKLIFDNTGIEHATIQLSGQSRGKSNKNCY